MTDSLCRKRKLADSFIPCVNWDLHVVHRISKLMINLNLSIDMYSVYSNEFTEITPPQLESQTMIWRAYCREEFSFCELQQ